MRVEDHPILGKMEYRKEVTIFYNEKPIKAFEGEPIASDLWAGIKSFLELRQKEMNQGGYFVR